MCLETSRPVGTEFQAFDAAKNCRRQNAENHLLIQQVIIKKMSMDCRHRNLPFRLQHQSKSSYNFAGFGIVNYDTLNIQ